MYIPHLGFRYNDNYPSSCVLQAIEKKMKHLERTPGSLRPPDPATILHNLPWLSGLEGDVMDTVLRYAEFLQLEQSDWLLEEGAESRGIYVIVSGLVKVCPVVNWADPL